MSFPRYPAYKDSGVEWLGEVPGHWSVTALKRGFDVTLGKMLQPDSTGPEDELLPYLRAANIQWDCVDSTDIKHMWLTKRDRAQLRLEYGDLLISEGGDVGRSCMWTAELEQCYFQNSVNRVRARDGHSNRYLYYWMSTVKDKGYIDVLCNKSTIAHFTAEKVAAVPVPLPTSVEQAQIAAFLDRETAKIDALVAEQRRLMALLKEKRQAVISHAVTRGLNPDAPMKPSGIEWLGDVPVHWSSPKLKSLAVDRPAAFTNGPFGSDLLTSELQDEGVPVIYIRDLKVDGYRRRSTSYVTADKAIELDKFRVDGNDILIAKVGDPPGFCCTYPEGEPSGIICQDVIRMKANAELVLPGYLCYLLNSQPGMEAIDSICVQLTRKRFSLADLHSLRLPLPPLTEQTKMLVYIDKSTGEFDTLTNEAQHAIDLLQERRTALISAAVTGQIDVRQLVPSVVEETEA